MLDSGTLFSIFTLKTAAPLLYLAANVENAEEDMEYTSTLLYLADKYHLLFYGRTITKDEHIYTHRGPIGKLAHEMSITWKEHLGDFYRTNLLVGYEDFLSKSDQEALDYIIEKFVPMSKKDLYRFVHFLPEWKKVEDLFELKDDGGNPRIKQLPVEPEDLLLLPDPNHYFNVSAEHIEESLMWMTGQFD